MKGMLNELENKGVPASSLPKDWKRLNDAQFHEIAQWRKVRCIMIEAMPELYKNGKRQLLEAYREAKLCTHPDAKWLCDVLEAGNIVDRSSIDRKYLRSLFEPLGDSQGGAALYFLAMARGSVPGRPYLMRSAKLGYAPAQATLVICRVSETMATPEDVAMLKLAAEQNDPDGLVAMAACCNNGLESQDTAVVLGYIFNAACAGSPLGQEMRGRLCAVTDPEKVEWFHRAACNDQLTLPYLRLIRDCMTDFSWTATTIEERRMVYVLGRALNGQVDCDRHSLYGKCARTASGLIIEESVVRCADDAVCVYEFSSRKTRDAVNAWTHVAHCLQIGLTFPKEIRRMISEYVWASRADGLYTADKLPRERDSHKRIRIDDGFT